MENFVNNTEVSFSQLTKKDGWFSRLIFIQLIVNPTLTLLFWIFLSLRNTEHLVLCGISIAGSLTIGFLLWKQRTRLTIAASIILLWILFVSRRVFRLLGFILMLIVVVHQHGQNQSLINFRIQLLIGMAILTVIALVLTVIWTKNLKKLKQLQT